MKVFLGSISFLMAITLNGQNFNFHPSSDCYENRYDDQDDSDTEFRRNLTLKMEIDEIYLDSRTYEVDFEYEEGFTNESSLIAITDDVAIVVLVARTQIYGKKTYLQDIRLYRRSSDCWEEESSHVSWSEFEPGRMVNGGLVYGEKGESGCIGYTGDIYIE